MRIGLFFKYDREVVNGSENREIPDLWGRVDRYVVGPMFWVSYQWIPVVEWLEQHGYGAESPRIT